MNDDFTERQKFEGWIATTGYAVSRCSESEDADYELEETQAASAKTDRK